MSLSNVQRGGATLQSVSGTIGTTSLIIAAEATVEVPEGMIAITMSTITVTPSSNTVTPRVYYGGTYQIGAGATTPQTQGFTYPIVGPRRTLIRLMVLGSTSAGTFANAAISWVLVPQGA